MKHKTKEMQARAMELVRIRPMSDAADALIAEAMAEHGFTNRVKAFQFLQDTGQLAGVDIGGNILNNDEVIAALIQEFGCHRDTARSHVAKAARRQRHPDWTPPQHGGRRIGAGLPSYYEQVTALLESGQFAAHQVQEIAAELGCHPRTVQRAVKKWGGG